MSIATQLDTARGRVLELGDEIDAYVQLSESEGRDLTEEETNAIAGLNQEFDGLTSKISGLERTLAVKEKITAGRLTHNDIAESSQVVQRVEPSSALPARVRSVKSKVFSSTLDAYQVGMWLQAALLRRPQAKKYVLENCDHSYRQAMEEGTDNLGGYSVPDPLAATIIELFEQWGVFRQYSRNVAMTSDTLDVPRLEGSLTVYYPGEGAAITPSDLTFGQVNLVAQKMAAYGIMSTELNEDSVISMTDLLVRDMARGFAYNEDKEAFLGDGTANYGGHTGIL
mgnify:FL=1